MMNVKEAVVMATAHIRDLFEHEEISNLGLEEVEFDQSSSEWIVTVGFSRPWDYPQNALAALGSGRAGNPKRSYKIVTINDNNSSVVGIKNREVIS
jgi:hypothetical protein